MKILILGGNGMIGHKIYQLLSKYNKDTWVLFKKDKNIFNKFNIFSNDKIIDLFDLSDLNKLNILLKKLNPDIVINAAGITIRRGVNDNIYKTILINSVLPNFLNCWATETSGKRFIHFSTDCVFSGKSGFYTENSIPDANDIYGKSKSLGEVVGPQTLTLRSSMIGRELDYHTELLDWFLLQKENIIQGYSNVMYSGITTYQMACYVKEIIYNHKNLNGIYNISSEPISKFELLNLLKKTFQINVHIEINNSYESNKVLISDNFFSTTKLKKPQWDDLLTDLKKDSYLNIYKKINYGN